MLDKNLYRTRIIDPVYEEDKPIAEKLKSSVLNEFKSLNEKITFQNTIVEVEQILGIRQRLLADLEKRLQIAPNPSIAIEKLLEDYYNEISSTNVYSHIRLGFDWISVGKNPTLEEIGYVFFFQYRNEKANSEIRATDITDNFLVSSELEDIAKGVAYAYFIPHLQNERNNLEKVDNSSQPNDQGNSKSEIQRQKLAWKGELKEFAELIDQLEKKGWIEINDRELRPTVESLCNVFDFSATKKKEDSNTVNSLNQYLKTTEREDKIYSKRYTRKFASILPNSSQKVVTK